MHLMMRSSCLQSDKWFIAKMSFQHKISNSTRETLNTSAWNTALSVKSAHGARFCVREPNNSNWNVIFAQNLVDKCLELSLSTHILLPPHVPTFLNLKTNAAAKHESVLQENLIRRYKRNVCGRHIRFNRRFDASASFSASFMHLLSFPMSVFNRKKTRRNDINLVSIIIEIFQ